MNLLDKKFQEKLNFFNNDYEEKKVQKINNLKLSKKKNSNFSKNIKNTAKNNFDKIYSDFYLFPYNNLYISNNNNKKNHSNEEKKLLKNYKFKGDKKFNEIKNNLKLYSNNNKYNKFNLAFDINFNNVSERLYNNSFLIKTKIDNKRKMREEVFKKNLIPKIEHKAKRIKKEEKKLCKNINKKMRTNLSQDNLYEKDKNFSFKPKLNKKSLKMAEKLKPFTERMNKKKSKISKDEIYELTKRNYTNLLGSNLKKNKIFGVGNYSKKLNRSMENINKKINEFYQKQFEKIKLKEKIYIENKLKNEEEYQNYPFHPIIKHNNNYLNKTHINEYLSPFERLYKTNKTCTKKMYFNDTKSTEIYTFKPEITPLNLKDDEKIIKYNITQNNFYILKRRKNLENLKYIENYKKKN